MNFFGFVTTLSGWVMSAVAHLPVAPPQVVVVPLGKLSAEKIKATEAMVRTYVPQVRVLPLEKMPAEAYYAPRKRYRADKLISILQKRAGDGEVYVGITEKDISTTKGKVTDWGVMGLGYKPGKGCVASTFRVKEKRNFPKVVVHELGHTMGLPHCARAGCLMQDAEGRDKLAGLNGFCSSCSRYLRGKGWKI